MFYFYRSLFPVSTREKFGLEVCNLADIDATTRPFQLTIPEFGRLCHAYREIISQHPKLLSYKRGSKEEDFEIDLDYENNSEENEINKLIKAE